MRWCHWIVISLGIAIWALSAQWGWAQPKGKAPDSPRERLAGVQDPAQQGLLLPPTGKRLPGGSRVVVAPDEEGKPVACRVHCQIGDAYLIVLPSGLMKTVRENEVTLTTRPFQGLSADELLVRLKKSGFAKFKSATTDRHVYLYGCGEGFYRDTRDILESLYEGVTSYLNTWKVPMTAPEVPLVVIIFPDRKSFNTYHKMPDEVLAYYSAVSNFVVLHEDAELSDAAPEFALKQAAYTIAHEGIHQIFHNVGIQKRFAPWPAWLSEGLPELFCPIKITSRMVTEGTAQLPNRSLRWNKLGLVNDLRMRRLLEMQTSKGSLVEKTVAGAKLDADGYAVAWGLAFFLSAKQPGQFREYLREVSTIEPFQFFPADVNKDQQAQFGKHFGQDFARLEADVAGYLTSGAVQAKYRDPIANQKHYVVVHNVRQGRAVQVSVYITTSPEGARKWREEQESNKTAYPANARHAFRTQECDNLAAAELIVTKIGGR